MTITPTFDPGDTIWFVDTFTLAPVSTTILYTDIHIDSTPTVTINYFISLNGIDRYVDQTKAFADQTSLGAYYGTP